MQAFDGFAGHALDIDATIAAEHQQRTPGTARRVENDRDVELVGDLELLFNEDFANDETLDSAPSSSDAAPRASVGESANLMAPALPRPPACICAFTATAWPISSAIAKATSGLDAHRPRGTGIPAFRRTSFAWASRSLANAPPSYDVRKCAVKWPICRVRTVSSKSPARL